MCIRDRQGLQPRGRIMGKYLINEYQEVEDPEASKTFGKGEKREDYADAWRDTGNVVLIGLPGSGKAELAVLLAERTGAPVLTPASGPEAAEELGASGAVIVLDDGLVGDPDVQPLIHGAGKVFYLMADSNTLSARVAERDGVEGREQLWRDMSARLAAMEPVFYGALHFILQAGGTMEEMVADAMEKIAYQGLYRAISMSREYRVMRTSRARQNRLPTRQASEPPNRPSTSRQRLMSKSRLAQSSRVTMLTQAMAMQARKMEVRSRSHRLRSSSTWSTSNRLSSLEADSISGSSRRMRSVGRAIRLVRDNRRRPMPEMSTNGAMDAWSIVMSADVSMTVQSSFWAKPSRAGDVNFVTGERVWGMDGGCKRYIDLPGRLADAEKETQGRVHGHDPRRPVAHLCGLPPVLPCGVRGRHVAPAPVRRDRPGGPGGLRAQGAGVRP
eukprot:TRINITY_DN41819_c0_g1_i1.p1 TRINITY_DN41819_c0_g1~~TRINITY_DN41819_c0_g1_i1.p1  ORF type:complete len:443 (-),score=100.12 TRINITY_DN41819_c0_g1_i1:191-1519(-)